MADEPKPPANPEAEERTKQVTAVCWTVGVVAFFALGGLASSPTWPVSIGVLGVSAMVVFVTRLVLNRN